MVPVLPAGLRAIIHSRKEWNVMLEFIIIALVILVAAWLQGAVGFGLGMITAPILALLRPDLLPATVIVLAFFTSLFVLLREWKAVDWRMFGWLFIGRLPGTLVGAVAVAVFAPVYISLLVGMTVIGGVVLSSLGWYPRPNGRNLIVAGAVSGVFGTSTSIGGPPIAIVMRRYPPGILRATMSAYFTVGSVVSLVALWVGRSFDTTHFLAAAALVPFVLTGLIVSNVVGRQLNGALLFTVGAIAALIGAALVILDGSITLWG